MSGPDAVLAAAKHSEHVTDWSGRLLWTAIIILVIIAAYWLMRQGWKWRAVSQGDVPPLLDPPAGSEELPADLLGRYYGSTTAGAWLDRVVVHGLGMRSEAELRLLPDGVVVTRPGSTSFFVPAAALRGARLDKAIAGKVVPDGGLLVITWAHGEREFDSGFRSLRPEQHAELVERIVALGGKALSVEERAHR